MDDSYYFLYNEEETQKVKEIKLELHKALKKNRERVKQVNKPMEASNVIPLIEGKNELKNKKNDKINDKIKHFSKQDYANSSLHKSNSKLPLYSEKNKKSIEHNNEDNKEWNLNKRLRMKNGNYEINKSLYNSKFYGENENKNKIKEDKNIKNDKYIENDNENKKGDVIEKRKRRINYGNMPSTKKPKDLTSFDKENKKLLKNPSLDKDIEKSVISIHSKESISEVSILSDASLSDTSSSTNYLTCDKKSEKTYDKKYEKDNEKNLLTGNASCINKNKYSKKDNISPEKCIGKEKNNAKEIYEPNNSSIKVHNNFKINYQSLTKNEKEYYNYMMNKLNVKYDYQKQKFYSDGMFIDNFAKIMQTEKGNFNYIGYLEYACFYILEWLTPTKEEKLLKLKALLKLEVLVKSIFPKSTMEVFGSFVTGLSIPGSDIDVCFMNVDGEDLDCLYIIAYALIKLNMNSDLKIIKDAKVKILKYTDKESGVQIDICINQKSSRQTTEFILKQIKEYIYLRPLVLLLKFFLNSRNLNETYTGGIGSFLLCCMVLHFLQMHQSTFDIHTYKSTYVAKLLVEFFNYYSIDYNINDNCSVIRGLGHIMPRSFRKEFEDVDRICFENPLDTSVDIGKNAYKIKYILYLFSYNFCNLITLISKLKKKRNSFVKSKENEFNNNNKLIEGSKMNTDSIYPLFYGNFINPDNIVFTKRIKVNFPSESWNINHFDFNYSKQEKNHIFEMFCDDVDNFLDLNYKYDNINLFSNFSKIFSLSLDIHNNIFKYT